MQVDANGYPIWWNEGEDKILQKALISVDAKWDKREGGFMYDALSAYSKVRAIQREDLKETLLIRFVDNASHDILDEIVSTFSPLIRNRAKPSSGLVQVIGNPGTTIPSGTRYMSLVEESTEDVVEFIQPKTAVIGDTGEVFIEIVCAETGIIGNVSAGMIEIASPVIGIAAVTNINAFDNGEEKEADDVFRSRFKRWRATVGSSGNVGDYIKWSLEVDGVAGVIVIPLWNGPKTVKVILTDIDFEPANQTIIDATKEYIDPLDAEGEGRGKAPVGAVVTIVPAAEKVVNIQADVTLKNGYDIQTVTYAMKNASKRFLLNLNKNGWSPNVRPVPYTLNYLKVGALLSDVEGVASISNLLINGQVENISVEIGEVFVLGGVTLVD